MPIETTPAVEPSTAVVPEPTPPVARLAGVAVHLPAETRDVVEVERDLHRRNPKVVPRVPMVSRLTGARTVHVAGDDEQASDLAVAAAGKVLAEAGLAASDVDLLIFASASQDMVEPATAHITAAKLGASCPVMDVKNACNSVLNAIEVAEALIGTGRYGRVLIACGEMPSRAVRWDVPDRATYTLSAPGYTMSDAGAAVLVEAVRGGGGPGGAGLDAAGLDGAGLDGAGLDGAGLDGAGLGGAGLGGAGLGGVGLDAELAGLAGAAPSGILASAFTAASRHWDVGMLPAGGTFNPRDPERSYFEIDGSRLREAFDELGPEVVVEAMSKAGVTWDDVGFVAVHQVALAYLDDVFGSLGVPRERAIVTISDHGNVASATLPLQLSMAEQAGRLRSGDVALLVGLAGGISMGAMVVRW